MSTGATTATLWVGGPAAARTLELTARELAAAPHQVPDVGAHVEGREGAAVSLRALAELAGATDAARLVHVESADGGFTANVDLATALSAGLVLHSLCGEPLPARYGGPFRLLFADVDDCSVNVKDLGRVEFRTDPGSHTARCSD